MSSHIFTMKHVFTRAGVWGKRRECMSSHVFTTNACNYEGRGVGKHPRVFALSCITKGEACMQVRVEGLGVGGRVKLGA
jgi:hypothetical protein